MFAAVMVFAQILFATVPPVSDAVENSGLTINLIRHYDGESFQGTLYADPPSDAVGGGNLDDIVAAAALQWQAAINDDVVIDLHYGWHAKPEGNANAGGAGAVSVSADGKSVVAKLFLNRTRSGWWLDSTPFDSSEFGEPVLVFDDLGGGELLVGGKAQPIPGGGSLGTDAVAVAIHEMGHVVGHSWGYPNYLPATGANVDNGYVGEVVVPERLPFAGTVIPTLYSHVHMFGPAMGGGGGRPTVTDVDILAAAVFAGYESLNLFGDIVSASGALGDVNCDGVVTVADAARTIEAAVGLVTAGECPLSNPAGEFDQVAADLNGDGVVTAVDAAILMQCVVGSQHALC